MKRGVKPWEEDDSGVMPLRVIALKMNLSERTIHKAYKNAMRKLREQPHIAADLQLASTARNIFQRDLIRCGSAECNRDFIAKYAELR